MEIFYIKKDEFLKKVSRQELEKVADGRKYKSETKYIEHLCGLYLVKYLAEKYYNLPDTEIILKNGKPVFKNRDLHFSISHSKDVVLVVFSKNNVGVDVEYMADRDFAGILKYYGKDSENLTKEEFYRFWTDYEASIKLAAETKSSFSAIIEDNYVLTILSDVNMVSDFAIMKV